MNKPKYDYSKATTEQLIMLNFICSMSEFPEDKEIKQYIMDELNTRLKKDPNIKLDLSLFGAEKE